MGVHFSVKVHTMYTLYINIRICQQNGAWNVFVLSLYTFLN